MPHRAAACLVILLALMAPPITAQPLSTLRGTVVDGSGAVIVGAEVRLEPVQGGAPLTARTDGQGRYAIERLAPGAYLLTVTSEGMHAFSGAVDVAGAETVGDVTLRPAGVHEDVIVTATRIATPLSSIPNTVTIVDSGAIEQRTAVSDDLASLLESNVPGFAPSMKKLTGRAESLRGRNPLYAINGVPQHTPLRDGERDGHTIDLDFVDRIEVIHGANAIQGIGATGGVVNLVTKAPRNDGAWTHDVKLSFGNADTFDRRGWSNKLSYLLGKKVAKVDVVAGIALQKRGLFFDARGDAIGLYPTQGDIMDSGSRGIYTRVGVDLNAARRLEVSVNDFRLTRDGDYVSQPGDRKSGRLTSTIAGDPRPAVGDPAENESTTVSLDYRDRRFLGGDASVQVYAQRFRALFEGGTFTTFALTPGGAAFLDQSQIHSDKFGAKVTYVMPQLAFAGITPSAGVDVSADRSDQALARTGRVWVPPTTFQEIAPFVQLQRLLMDRVVLSAGTRVEFAELKVRDFTTLPSSRSTFVSGGSPRFTEVLPNVGAVVPLTSALSVYSSYSEGFTMPDVGRVLRAVNVPNQDVDRLVDVEPIVAGNLEAGADVRLQAARFHAAWYRSSSDRGALLERDAENIFHVRRQRTAIQGVDLVAEARIAGNWSAGANYAWIRGRFDSDGDGRLDTGLDGLNIAPNRLNLFVEREAAGSVAARLQVSTLLDRRFTGRAAPVGHDFRGYTTADASVAVPARIGLFRLGIENLFDRQYVIYFSQVDPVGGNDTFFAGPGRSFTIGFERRF